jgi:DNA-binding transcriptional ArsR family regulator
MDKLFGSKARTDVLVALARLGSTYVSEIARVVGRRPIEVQRSLASLELTGAVQTRRVGTIRAAELNKRYPEYERLLDLLLAMGKRPDYARMWKAVRRRPRAMGKAL